jgi:hypothetical protein
VQDLEVRHELDCDPDTYWEKCVLDDDFNRRFFLEALKFPSYKLLEQKDSGTEVLRRVLVEPTLAGLPGPVKKVVGDSMTYLEEGTYDRSAKRYRFTTAPTGSLKEKAKTSGEMFCESRGDKKCLRIARLHVDVKVFMVGGLIEERIVSDLRSSYDKSAQFTNQFLREKGY